MMTFNLIRKPLIAALAGLTVISWMIADSQTSDAQLFRRLRNRIQYRPPALQPPNDQFQPNVPQYNQQQQTDPDDGLDPRRVAPVNPAEPRKNGATRSNSDPRLAPATSASQTAQPVPGDQVPNANKKSFGNSILPKANANTAGDGQRQPAFGGTTERMTPDASAVTPKLAPQKRASLGIQVVESRQGIPGLMVTRINPGSQAPSAGLRVGDLIISFDGRTTESIAEISNLLASRNGGDNVQIRIVRDRSTSLISVPLMGNPLDRSPTKEITPNQPTAESVASKPIPDANNPGLLGLRYANVEGQRGALITDVQANSPASTSGIQTGDRIVSIDGRLLVSAEALQQTLGNREADATIGVRMVRNGKLLSAKIDPQGKPTATDSLATNNGETTESSKKSVLGGVGAIFGDLLKGKSKPKPTDELALGDDLELVDEMDLGDDEGVKQVDFETDVAAEKKDKSTDPLSLEALEPPPIDEEETTGLLPPQQAKEKSSEELQKEIEALKDQIKAFQENK